MNVDVTLDEWERAQFACLAASNAMTYCAHFTKGGAWTAGELELANRWKAVSAKLSGVLLLAWVEGDFPSASFRPSR
jgi:hypothetical protein